MDLLQTVPGIGLLTAIEILMELYDIQRFENGDRLASFICLTPKEHSTGEAVNTKRGHITHAGNSSLRALFVELAWRVIRKDPAMADRFSNVQKRRGKKIAIVALARILAVRIRHILVTNDEYVLGLAQ